MGTSGDISDLQFTIQMLKAYENQETCYDDGHEMDPKQWHTALAAQMYKRRTDMNPLWNSHVIAGVDAKTGEMYALAGCARAKLLVASSGMPTCWGPRTSRTRLRPASAPTWRSRSSARLWRASLWTCRRPTRPR